MVIVKKKDLLTALGIEQVAQQIFESRSVSGELLFVSWEQPDGAGADKKVNLDLSVHERAPKMQIGAKIRQVAGMSNPTQPPPTKLVRG